MKNYTTFEAKAMDTWSDNVIEVPEKDLSFPGKLMLLDKLDLSSCQVSLNALKSGQGTPFRHSHQKNEELYIFLSGEGEFQVDDDVFPIQAGSTIKVDLAGERAWRNTGQAELVFIVIQATKDSLIQHTGEDGVISEAPPSWQ